MEALLAGYRLLVLAALAWWCGAVSVVRRPAGAPPTPRPLRWFVGGIVALFGLTLGWQAFWTLRAGTVPAFRRVDRYDSRGWRLIDPRDRRAVTDRFGESVIVSRFGEAGARRVYPLGSDAAHLTGYLDRVYGKAGLEAVCDDRLATWRRPAWATLAEAVEHGATALPEPLKLTLDARLQRAAATALGRHAGAVVVLNPAEGDLLAVVSGPSYDPNAISGERFDQLAERSDSPLLDRALHGLYPPGSTFKPVVAAAALARGYPVETEYEIGPDGYLAPGDTQPVRDFEATALPAGRVWRGHGPLTMPAALARSANGYFACLGVCLGAEPVLEFARRFGLDRGFAPVRPARAPDLTSTAGRLPSGRLRPGDVARLAIGQQELLVTPLGMALTAATVANYGLLAPPRLLLDQSPPAPEPVLDTVTARAVQALMAGVVARPGGTGAGLRGAGVPVAAKTGSAENPGGPAHGWVIAFAPVEQATIALAVLVEHGGTGSGAAVPIARAVLRAAREAGYFGSPEAGP